MHNYTLSFAMARAEVKVDVMQVTLAREIGSKLYLGNSAPR